MGKLLVPVLILLALVLGMTALDRPAPRADFRFINRGDVTTLDFAQMSWMQDLRVARMISEGLTRNDIFTDSFEIKPAVAERWDVSPDGRVYTFHLRENARWSNGEPVTSRDFYYSWRRSLMPDLAGDYIKLFAHVKGGREFIAWRTRALADFASDPDRAGDPAAARALYDQTLEVFARTVGLETPDDRTLVVTLERPTPYFLDLTSFAVFYPVYPAVVEAHTSIDPRSGAIKTRADWTKPGRLITNGPFKLVTWRFKRDMRFERNPHYWNPSMVAVDSISIPSVQDNNAQVLAFRTGAVDWVSDVTTPYRAEMLAQKQEFYREHWDEYQALRAQGLDMVEIDRRLPPDPRNQIHAFPAFGTYFYNFNCRPRLADGRPNPFADARVRRAFALAIDKDAIVTNVRRSGEPVANTLVPRNAVAGYRSPAGLGYDPAAARTLLAEAGYPNGEGFITVEVLFNKDAGHEFIAQSIAKDWERNLGVRVSLQMKEIKVFREDLKNQNFMTSRAGWFGDYGDPTTFLDLNETGNGNNDRGYSSAAYDALLAQAREETDPAKRLEILSQAEELLVEQDLPLIPIFHYVQIYLFDPHRITGISSHPRQEQNMFEVDVFNDGKGTDEPKVMRRGADREGAFRIAPAP